MATTTNPTTAHFREILGRDVGAHLRAAHGIADADIPKTKQAQDKLHRTLDHDTHDAKSDADVSVLAGVTRKPDEPKAANLPKPKPSARKRATETVVLPGDEKPTTASKPAARTPRKPAQAKPAAPATSAPKTTRKPAQAKPATKPAEEAVVANGASPREHNQEVARQLLAAVTTEFAGASKDDQQKVANWLHMLPTGGEGAGWLRYWPQDFPRPTSAGWRKPE